jgi:hypothetical protein
VIRRASVSIADLVADGVPIHPPEAVAVIDAICALSHGPDVEIPDAAEILLFRNGSLFASLADRRGEPPVKSLAKLLRAMLDRAPLGHGASPDLCRQVACGMGLMGGKELMTVEGFAEALRPFANLDTRGDIRQLFARWQSASELSALHPRLDSPLEVIVVTTSGFEPVARLKPDRRKTPRVVVDAGAESVDPILGSSSATERLAIAPLSEVSIRAASRGVSPRRVWPQRALALVALLIAFLIPAGRRVIDSSPPAAPPSREVQTDKTPDRERENARSALATSPRDVAGFSSAESSQPERLTSRRSLQPSTASLGAIGAVRPLASTGAGRTGIRPALAASDEPESFESNNTAVFVSTEAAEVADARVAAPSAASGDLHVMRIVDDGARSYHVRPSPDGTRVAFDSDRDGTRGVYVANRDGTGVRRVSDEAFAALPSWSPDGTRLAFVRASGETANVWNVWICDLDSGTIRQVSFHPEGKTSSASWFPDGTRITYSRGSHLWILDLATGRARDFVTPNESRLHSPAVAPDGARVVFRADRDGTWLLDLENGGMRRVLEDPSAEAVSWSPDGRRLAYYSRRDASWVIRASPLK